MNPHYICSTRLYTWVQLCPSSQAFSVNAFRLRIQVSKTNSLGLHDPKRIGLIMLATSKSMIEREQPPFPNQLKPDRPDSWASVFGVPRGTFGKPRHGGHQILFHEYAPKLIRSRKSPPFLWKFVLWQRTAKLRSAWRSTVGTTGKPHKRLSQAERGQADEALGLGEVNNEHTATGK